MDAAKLNGISQTTFYSWMETGEADSDAGVESAQRELWERVKIAETTAKVRALGLIAKAMPVDWRAAAWFMERKHPDEFGRRGLDVRVSGETTVRTNYRDLSGLSDEDLADYERLMDLTDARRDDA